MVSLNTVFNLVLHFAWENDGDGNGARHLACQCLLLLILLAVRSCETGVHEILAGLHRSNSIYVDYASSSFVVAEGDT